MPPSPSLRISEVNTESHKSGRSLERRIAINDKEDDLALFNEVQNKERENYLLQSNYDLDDIIFSTKIKQLSSDHKVGFSVPSRGESSDLLNAVDKNDYDWLITPPESPLFPFLDDDGISLHNGTRGRTRSQPVPISRSSKVEKGGRNARGSPSPRRPSPSSRSGNTVLQSRSRPFPQNSPTRRLSPPPSKLTTLAAVSSTPDPRRMSTGSVCVAQSRRGTSPVKTSRGSSVSPKTRAWQSNIPAFSSEAPINLCTSLADRPGSYVRGSSPASRNDSRSARQSMSPTASRSVSSSYSHEMDPFSSYSKGSVGSSRHEETDSLPSNPFSCSDYLVQRDICALPKNRSMGVSNKSTKIFSSSAPRQVDKRGRHNMFRPLLSSVPSSTFHVGKGRTSSRPLVSGISSIATSSNANSDKGTCAAHDTEEWDQNQDEMGNNFLKQQNPGMIEEAFAMDAADASNKDVDDIVSEHPEKDDPFLVFPQQVATESSSVLMDSAVITDAASTELCSRCYTRYHSAELVTEGDQRLCRNCMETAMAEARFTENDVTSPQEWIPVENIAETLQLTDGPDLRIDGEPGHEQKLLSDVYLSSKCDLHEAKGLSLLLKRSASAQGHIVVPSRSYTASNTSYDDFSYMRDSVTSIRSSFGLSSVSMLSSIDSGSYKSTEAGIHAVRNPSPEKNDGFEIPTRNKSGQDRGAALNSECAEASACSGKESGLILTIGDSGASILTPDEPTPLEISDVTDDEPEVPQLGILDAISETETRTADKSSITELVGNVSAVQDDHISYASGTENAAGFEDGYGSRSLTLEEATDVILICSSIAHDILYNAANIAINRESLATGIPTTVPFPSKNICDKKENRSRTLARRRSKMHKTRKTESEIEPRSPQSVLAENEGASTSRILLSPSPANLSNSSVPQKLESKCNCTIM